MSNSSLVNYTKLSPNYNTRTAKINKITVHHMAGNLSVQTCGNIFAKASSEASANYGIDTNGLVGLYVDEKNKAWTSSNAANDNQAITIEVANDGGAPDWHVSDKALNKLVELCVDICKRNGIKRLNYTGYANGNLTRHNMFIATTCVPTFTEVLTHSGWKSLKDVEIGEKIACADLDNLNITFEEVYVKVPVKSQDTYTNNGLTATKDHRMVYRTQYNNAWRIDEYANLLGKQSYIPLAGTSNFSGLEMSDVMLKFLIAVQADGHYMYEYLQNNEKSYYGLEFHVKKERKIQAIKYLIEQLDLQFTESHKSDGSVSIRIYNQDGINIVNDICEVFLTDKMFNWKWINLSPSQAKLFLNEILLWDGSVAGNKYTSKEQINLDVVNAIAALNNVGSRISSNDVLFRETPYMTLNGNTHRNCKTVKKNIELTQVTCVSVKTGIFLARQHGKTFVIGNCPGPYLQSKLPWLANEVNKRLESKKSITEIAKEVIQGKWGNGIDRKNKLTSAGYDYNAVQSAVNQLVSNETVATKKSVEQIAKEVVQGKWGNGEVRKQKLTAAGYDYNVVQKKVNELL